MHLELSIASIPEGAIFVAVTSGLTSLVLRKIKPIFWRLSFHALTPLVMISLLFWLSKHSARDDGGFSVFWLKGSLTWYVSGILTIILLDSALTLSSLFVKSMFSQKR